MVLTPLRDLFATIFFLGIGLSVDPGKLVSMLPVALALAAVTAATKVATGMFAARREGVARRGQLRAGTALVARGVFFDHHRAGRCLDRGLPPWPRRMCSSWRSSVRYWPATPAVGCRPPQ